MTTEVEIDPSDYLEEVTTDGLITELQKRVTARTLTNPECEILCELLLQTMHGKKFLLGYCASVPEGRLSQMLYQAHIITLGDMYRLAQMPQLFSDVKD